MAASPQETLAAYRAKIDAIDDQLIALLHARIDVVREVAALKRREWPKDCHVRSGREGMMHERIAGAFRDSAFPARAALTIWREIIGASTNLESPLRIVTAGESYAALAQEYFGSVAQVAHSASVHAALAAIAAKRFSMLVGGRESLPVVAAQAPQLKIFAALPLIANEVEAFALAAIEPEPSGHDVSYFLEQGRVTSQPGFVTEQPGAQWLGAHPRPIRL